MCCTLDSLALLLSQLLLHCWCTCLVLREWPLPPIVAELVPALHWCAWGCLCSSSMRTWAGHSSLRQPLAFIIGQALSLPLLIMIFIVLPCQLHSRGFCLPTRLDTLRWRRAWPTWDLFSGLWPIATLVSTITDMMGNYPLQVHTHTLAWVTLPHKKGTLSFPTHRDGNHHTQLHCAPSSLPPRSINFKTNDHWRLAVVVRH